MTDTYLYVDQGSTFSEKVYALDSTGAPINLVGFTAAGQYRKWYGEAVYTFFGCTITNAATGEITLSATEEDTIAMTPGRMVYDVQITSSGGIRTKVQQGQLIVSPGLTNVLPANITLDSSVNLTITQGSDFTYSFELSAEDGTIQDLTGYTAHMQIRPTSDSPVIILDLTTANNLLKIQTGGIVTMSIPAATTAAFTFDSAVYDLEVTSPSSVVTRVTGGSISLIWNITK